MAKAVSKPGFWARLCEGGVLRRFRRDSRASAAVNFALCMIPLMAMAGTAVDLARGLMVRQRLLHAIDSAGLAVGKSLNLPQADMQKLANDFFKANYPANALGSPGPLTINTTGDSVTLQVSASVNTTLLQIIGIKKLDITVSNEVTRATRGLELALVLDTTGSMADDSPAKIDSLKTAANQLLDILFGASQYPTLLKVGIVPFSTQVKVDPVMAVNNNWIDTTCTNNQYSKANFNGGKCAYWLYTNVAGLSNTPWTGCVEQRPNQNDEWDMGPSDAVPDSKWAPMFWPDEPHLTKTTNVTFSNDYLTTDFTFTSFVASSNSTTAPNSTLTAQDHGFVTGDGPFRLTGSLPNKLSTSTDYYAIVKDANTIWLATSKANATAGTKLVIGTGGSGALTLAESASPNGANLAMQAIRQKNWRKYVGKNYSGQNGPYMNCNTEQMMMLTNDKAALQNKISALQPNGNTHVPVGLGWGWRIISSKLPGSGAVSDTNQDYVKAIVLMTDGANTETSESNSLNSTQYTAYGFGAQQRMGAGINTASEVQSEIDNSMTRVCNNIKALQETDPQTGKQVSHVRLYTIAFGTDVSTSQQNLLCNCAGDADQDAQPNTTCPKKRYFYAPSGDELQTAFQVIATDLANLRISK
jgi:Flp pilus assembly protein TadG